jgi:hypothetical protein
MSCKLNIILDLDNTLVHTIMVNDYYLIPYMERSKFISKQLHSTSNMITCERPHLQTFLDYIFRNFNVAVYTLGTREYAIEIVKKCILCVPGRRVDFVLHRQNAIESSFMYPLTLKDLRYVWNNIRAYGYVKCNTFIIDDNELVRRSNIHNTISIEPFEMSRHSHKDRALITAIGLLKNLKAIYHSNQCIIHSNNKLTCASLHDTIVGQLIPTQIKTDGTVV